MSDEAQRKAFCEFVDENFSVIAPAGVGKTFSIVERIYRLADIHPSALSQLYVITYTKKAADTLRDRTFQRLKQHPDYIRIAPYFQKSFFGTIHSLCWEHIRKFDPEKTYELLQDDRSLQQSFLAQLDLDHPDFLPYKKIFRFLDLEKLLTLTSQVDPFAIKQTVKEQDLTVDIAPILNYEPESRNKISVTSLQSKVARWVHLYETTDLPLALPECFQGGENFKQLFYATFFPFYHDLEQLALSCVCTLAKHYFDFRRQAGFLKYEDLIYWSKQCLQIQSAQDFFKEQPISILLDEAQDTDRAQFDYLLTLLSFRDDNHFSMVGDPQQSIYGDRADVGYYLKIHKDLIEKNFCKELIFSQTFRCPSTIVSVLNQQFPRVLNSTFDPKQVNYVPLASALNAQGKFSIIEMKNEDQKSNPSYFEAEKIAEFLKTCPSESLSQTCILCPRKEWLSELQKALAIFNLQLQVHSSNLTARSNPLFCNCLAAIHLINFPEDTFEKAGLLHQTFLYPEEDIFSFFREQKSLKASDLLASKLKEVAAKTLVYGTWLLIDFFKEFCATTIQDPYFVDLLLNIAFKAQQQGQSWAYLEERLWQNLHVTVQEEYEVQENAIQGFSCHKAKGLEWKNVIVPFFYRPIRSSNKTYPLIYKDRFYLNAYSYSFSDSFKERVRELQRLLYVTCTRAKDHLVLIKDNILWRKESNAPSFGNFFNLL